MQALIPTSRQTVTADTGTPGQIVTTSLGAFAGPFLVLVEVPTTAAGPVYLTTNEATASATASGVVTGIPVPTVAGSTWSSGPLADGDATAGLYLYAAASTVCNVSLVRVLS